MHNLINKQPYAKQFIDNMHKSNRLNHAYIFSGEDGCGKEEMAKYFAAKLYCKSDEVCYKCSECSKIFKNEHINVFYVEPIGQTIKKEQIINLQKEFSKTSLQQGSRVYIIKDAHLLNAHSANSMLKFIEEPQGDEVYAIFLTNSLASILPTIISRCVVINFFTNKEDLKRELEEKKVNKLYIKHLLDLTNNIEDALLLAENENFVKSVDILKEFKTITKEKDKIIFINKFKDFFDSVENVKMFIDLIIIYYEEQLKSIDSKLDNKDILTNIELLIDLRKKINYYISPKTIINNLFLNLIG